MKLKTILSLMLICNSFISFAMESPIKISKEEVSPFADLPIEVLENVMVQKLSMKPQLSIAQNFKTILPNQINDIYKIFGYSDGLKDLIYQKIVQLIKNKYSPAKIDDALLEIARLKNPKAVDMARILLEAGADPNVYDATENPLLGIAAREDNLPMVKFLLENGAEVNVKNRSNQTPLSGAVTYGSLATVKYLIDHNADVNLDPNILFQAILSPTKEKVEKAKILIDNGVNLTRKSPLGWGTALMFSREKSKPIAKLIEDKLKEQGLLQ